ncbi:LysR family transcriptional regulator [Falsiroseomonas sp. E2-1-a20]|uniref:LysR family transcriptional regulator n=1 Tax=Falsiroseomonas sp. E2-1-a20 TaxID=3239300 RepID=UPI003F2E6DDD
MPDALPPLIALRTFALVAETGSLTAAGARLNLTQPAVSRRIRELEAALGVTLVHRGANALRLTDDGLRYAAALQQAFGAIAAATLALQGAAAPPLRVRAYTTWAMRWLIPRLPRFRTRHPGVEVEVVTSTTPVVDFAREGLDAAIRSGPAGAPPARGAVRLQQVDVAPYAAPGAARLGLGQLTLLGSRVRPRDWACWFAAAGLPIPAAPPLLFESSSLAIQAALEGLGAVISPPGFVEEDVRRRRLRRLSPVLAATGDHYWLLLPPGAARDRGDAFWDWLLDEVAAMPMETPSPPALSSA